MSGSRRSCVREGKMRVNKYIRDSGICSRREADRLIEEGRVEVNGKKALPGMQVEEDAVVTVNGDEIHPVEEKIVLAYHKPAGVVCTADQKEKNSVFYRVKTPVPVTYAGRLDKDSEGLLLLTNDGDLIDRLMRGRYGHEREYAVTVDHPVTKDFISGLKAGVRITDPEKHFDQVTRPCKAYQTGKCTFTIILRQGLNRQIRRMCEALGYRVTRLIRVRIENIRLGDLAPDACRRLTTKESEELYGRSETGTDEGAGDALK